MAQEGALFPAPPRTFLHFLEENRKKNGLNQKSEEIKSNIIFSPVVC